MDFFLKRVFGSKNERELRRLNPIVEENIYPAIEEFLKDWENLQKSLNRPTRPVVPVVKKEEPSGIDKKQIFIFSAISFAIVVITALLIYFLK